MCEWHDTEGIRHEYKHRREVVLQLERIEERTANDHGHLHFDNVKEQVDNPVRTKVHARYDLHMLQVLLAFVHHSANDKTR